MIKELFKTEDKDKKALFNKPKRFPGKDKDDKYFPPIKVLRIPLHIFEERREIEETCLSRLLHCCSFCRSFFCP